MIDDMPNVLVLNDSQESPDEIIEDYYASIRYAVSKGDYNEILMLLELFWDDVNIWTIKQVLIDQTKLNIDQLEEIDKIESEFIEEDEDDDDFVI